MNTSKQINIMVALVFAAVIATGAYSLWDPHRAGDAKQTQRQKTLDRGAYLFAQNCRLCHGDKGQGGGADNRLALAPPLNRPDLQGRKAAGGRVDAGDKALAYKLVFNTITCGRVGKAMPTWGDSQGGPLNPEQIKQLAIFITEGSAWDKAAELADHPNDLNHIRLTKPVDASSTEVFVSNAAPIGKDAYVQIDGELMHVTAVNQDTGGVTVERPAGNTKSASHDAGARVLTVPPIVDPANASITQPACGQTLPPAVPTGPAGSPTPAPTPAANAQKLEIVGENISFDKNALTGAAGQPITLTFDNKDSGVQHNIHFFEGTSASGTSVAETAIETGPVVQTLSFGPLQPGTYYYQCDVHPTVMTGTLTVQ